MPPHEPCCVVSPDLNYGHWSQIIEDIGKPSLSDEEFNLIAYSLENQHNHHRLFLYVCKIVLRPVDVCLSDFSCVTVLASVPV